MSPTASARSVERRLHWGAALLGVRVAYVPLELAVVARATGSPSLRDDTVSDFGAVGCLPELCSPWHAVLNGSFVVIGALLAAGALLLAPRLGRLATGVLVVAGLSSIATGFFPIDRDPLAHGLAAAPLFVAQPLALLLLTRLLWPLHRPTAGVVGVTGVVTTVAAVAFLAADTDAGLYERIALWPIPYVLALVGIVLARGGQRRMSAPA